VFVTSLIFTPAAGRRRGLHRVADRLHRRALAEPRAASIADRSSRAASGTPVVAGTTRFLR